MGEKNSQLNGDDRTRKTVYIVNIYLNIYIYIYLYIYRVVRARMFAKVVPCLSLHYDWRVIEGTCGGDLFSTGATSSLVAGNFSFDGRSSMRCKWLISAPISEQVEFNVTSLVLNANCDNNYLLIGQQPHVSFRKFDGTSVIEHHAIWVS